MKEEIPVIYLVQRPMIFSCKRNKKGHNAILLLERISLGNHNQHRKFEYRFATNLAIKRVKKSSGFNFII